MISNLAFVGARRFREKREEFRKSSAVTSVLTRLALLKSSSLTSAHWGALTFDALPGDESHQRIFLEFGNFCHGNRSSVRRPLLR